MDSVALTDDIERLERALDEPGTAHSEDLAAALGARLIDTPCDAPPEALALAVRGLIAAYRQRYRTGALGECGLLLDAAMALSADLDPRQHIGILLARGKFDLLMFDIGAALERTAAAMELSRANGLRVEEARAWTDYALALHSAGLYRQADERLVHALSLIDGMNEPYLRADILTALFGCLLELEEFEAAADACEKAIDCAEASPSRVRDTMVCTVWCNWAVLEILRGRVRSARLFLKNAGARPNLGVRPRWLIETVGALADLRVDNSPEHRQALEALLHPERAQVRTYVIETYAVAARLFAALGDRTHANQALARLSAERAKAQTALLRAPEVLPATAVARTPGSPAARVAHAPAHTSLALLERLAITAELRDDTTGRHCFRVGRLSMLLARRAGLPEEMAAIIDIAGRLHDIGKIAIPDAILLKPGRLDAEEMRLMRTHTTLGADLLAGGGTLPLLHAAEVIARHHHEWWNGEGYPAGLAGEQIPPAARITALADVYDALTHSRPYKVAWPRQESLDYIRDMRGRQFDPQLTDLFLRMMREAEDDWDAFHRQLEDAATDSPFIITHARVAHAIEQEAVSRG